MSTVTGPRTITRTVDLFVYEEVDETLPLDLRVRLRLVLLVAAVKRRVRRRTGRARR